MYDYGVVFVAGVLYHCLVYRSLHSGRSEYRRITVHRLSLLSGVVSLAGLGIWRASIQWVLEEFVLMSIVDHIIDSRNLA